MVTSLRLSCVPKLENVLEQIPLPTGEGGEHSEPGEGFHKYFFNDYRFCTPHPVLRTTLSRWERGLQTPVSVSVKPLGKSTRSVSAILSFNFNGGKLHTYSVSLNRT
jgi:hypothetical protein